MSRKLTSRDVSAFIAAKIDRFGKVILPGLGTLRLVDRAPRRIRHPSTGELYQLPPRQTLAFKISRPRKRS
jgi:nucleoid DNA-binding protein